MEKRGEGLSVLVLYNNIVSENNQSYTFAVYNSAKKLGENMKRIRLEKQMSQGDICRKLAVDRSYISNVENGNKNPTLSTITKLAKALDVRIEELLK